MSKKAQKDDELWNLVEALEEAQQAGRELRKQTAAIKTLIFKKLSEASKDGNYATLYRNHKRVRVVEVKSTDFSVSDLKRKYGEEFVEENRIDRYNDTIEIKEMTKRGPESQQS